MDRHQYQVSEQLADSINVDNAEIGKLLEEKAKEMLRDPRVRRRALDRGRTHVRLVLEIDSGCRWSVGIPVS